ncbi:hypothetical protein [Streptomyces sp. NPDC058953]|uniref:bestrophin-like domain n=1 Tax=unclassified Streptomyces TaxID=2593676 RepID=UPI00367FC014
MVVVIVVAVLALLAGLAANRRLRPRLVPFDDGHGLALKDVVEPLLMLTVLLLAFVLVTASGSYGKAEVASRGEARALDHMAEIAEYVPAAHRARIQTAAVCYARAVRVQEWPAMADGDGSSAPGVWAAEFRHTFRELEGDKSFGLLVAADNKRSQEREERLTQATASVPAAILWFLLATVAITILTLAICLPRRRNRGQIAVLVVITGILASTLCIIRDADRPFGGVITIPSAAMTETEREATRDHLAHGGPADFPCDGDGDRR